MPRKSMWDKALEQLRPQVGDYAFERWFSGTRGALAPGGKTLVLTVPNAIHEYWLESNYAPMLQQTLLQINETPLEVRYEIADIDGTADVDSLSPVAFPAEKTRKRSASTPSTSSSTAGDAEKTAAKAVTDANRPTERALFPETPNSAPASPPYADYSDLSGQPQSSGLSDQKLLSMGLNPRYSFESFVVGGNCQFAAAAAQAVAEKPGRVYNPLFIYGGVGLGKTHLMHAIGQNFLAGASARGGKKKPQVTYVTSEEFTNQFIQAIAQGSMDKFRRKYRRADLLLIDDVQFLADKGSTQEEFFHTFNALFDSRKQIILTSDRPPSEISEIEKRLVSRFEWGLTAELLPPSLETRAAILHRKAMDWNVVVKPEIIDYLANRIRSNVRRLEGALIRVASFAALGAEKLDQDRVDELLKDFLREEIPRAVQIEKIQRLVAEDFGIEFADMTSKARPRRIAFPRQIAMYLARVLSGASLKEIGRSFGGRDHGTVLYAHRVIGEQMADDAELRLRVEELQARLSKRDSQ